MIGSYPAAGLAIPWGFARNGTAPADTNSFVYNQQAYNQQAQQVSGGQQQSTPPPAPVRPARGELPDYRPAPNSEYIPGVVGGMEVQPQVMGSVGGGAGYLPDYRPSPYGGGGYSGGGMPSGGYSQGGGSFYIRQTTVIRTGPSNAGFNRFGVHYGTYTVTKGTAVQVSGHALSGNRLKGWW